MATQVTTEMSREQAMLKMQRDAAAGQLLAVPAGFDLLNRRPKRLADLSVDVLVTIRIRMFALGALVWDYVGTVLDMAKILRRSETRRLNRTIKQLRDEYFRYRAENYDRNHLEMEMQWALEFEEFMGKELAVFCQAVEDELRAAFGEIDPDHLYALVGVQQAMAMLEAMMHYTNGCNMAIAKSGVDMRGKTLLPPHFRKLAKLLPEFAGDMWIADSPSRRKVADQIALELTKIVVEDRDGDLELPEVEL